MEKSHQPYSQMEEYRNQPECNFFINKQLALPIKKEAISFAT